MERTTLKSAVVHYCYLQGLLGIPIGMWFILVGLVQLRPGPAAPWVIGGGTVLAGLLPVWGGLSPDSDIPMALLPMGVATIVSGLLDHGVLVRNFGSAQALDLGDGNVGAA